MLKLSSGVVPKSPRARIGVVVLLALRRRLALAGLLPGKVCLTDVVRALDGC